MRNAARPATAAIATHRNYGPTKARTDRNTDRADCAEKMTPLLLAVDFARRARSVRRVRACVSRMSACGGIWEMQSPSYGVAVKHHHTVHIRSRSRGSCFLGGPRRLLGAAEGDGHKALGAE